MAAQQSTTVRAIFDSGIGTSTCSTQPLRRYTEDRTVSCVERSMMAVEAQAPAVDLADPQLYIVVQSPDGDGGPDPTRMGSYGDRWLRCAWCWSWSG